MGIYKDEIIAILSPSKRKLTGWWEGRGKDIYLPELVGSKDRNLDYSVKVELKQKGKRITGVALITADINFKISLKGKFINDDYFYLEWTYSEKIVNGFGYSVCRVLSIGDQIEATTLFSRLRSDGIALNRLLLVKT